MRILVTFAVEAEFAPWRKLRDFAPMAYGWGTEIRTAETHVILTGVGLRGAEAILPEAMFPELGGICISSGFAGALRAECLPGDVLVAREIRRESGDRAIPCDEHLIQLARDCGARVVDAFCTSDRMLITIQDKKQLANKADAVDMESYPVLQLADSKGLKIVAIRAVSDAVDENLPLDFSRVIAKDGQVSAMRFLVEIARKPGVVPDLMRFGRRSQNVACRLAAFLDRYMAALAERARSFEQEQVAAT